MESIINYNHVNIDINGTTVIADASFALNKGEFIYLVGKTGSGKSSLIKSLYGAHRISTGVATVCDYNLSELKAAEIPYLRRKIGIVFQDFQLLPDQSVLQNLWLVLKATGWEKEAAEKRIDEVLNEVGLGHIKAKHPMQLSGGEQQRVVIARALLNNPPLILADEPTGNLDPETSNEVMQLLLKINREHNTAILMATHNYQLIERYLARILKCESNQLTEEKGLVFK